MNIFGWKILWTDRFQKTFKRKDINTVVRGSLAPKRRSQSRVAKYEEVEKKKSGRQVQKMMLIMICSRKQDILRL